MKNELNRILIWSAGPDLLVLLCIEGENVVEGQGGSEG